MNKTNLQLIMVLKIFNIHKRLSCKGGKQQRKCRWSFQHFFFLTISQIKIQSCLVSYTEDQLSHILCQETFARNLSKTSVNTCNFIVFFNNTIKLPYKLINFKLKIFLFRFSFSILAFIVPSKLHSYFSIHFLTFSKYFNLNSFPSNYQ